MLLARQWGPLEHRALGALTGPRATHLLAWTTASRLGMLATAEACLGTGTCWCRALSYRENKKGDSAEGSRATTNLIVGAISIGAKALQIPYTPPRVRSESSQRTKE